MPIENDYPLRAGDHILIRAKVKMVGQDGDLIVCDVGHSTVYPERAEIEKVVPTFKPGDKVIIDSEDSGAVLAVDGDEAWVRLDFGSKMSRVVSVRLLDRYEEPEPKAEMFTEPSKVEWKPMEGPNPVADVLGAIAKDGNVDPAFKSGLGGK